MPWRSSNSFFRSVCFTPAPNSPLRPNLTCETLVVRGFLSQNGRKIELDHFLVFYTHYEIGCTLERMGKYEEAIREFELVLHGTFPSSPSLPLHPVCSPLCFFIFLSAGEKSGKPPEVDTSKMTGKYSLHSGVTLKCSAAIQQIKEKQSASK